jgi:hypothetical protein
MKKYNHKISHFQWNASNVGDNNVTDIFFDGAIIGASIVTDQERIRVFCPARNSLVKTN